MGNKTGMESLSAVGMAEKIVEVMRQLLERKMRKGKRRIMGTSVRKELMEGMSHAIIAKAR